MTTDTWAYVTLVYSYYPLFTISAGKSLQKVSPVLSSNCRCVKWNMLFSSKLGIEGLGESSLEISGITG